MNNRAKPSIYELISLCDFDTTQNLYVSKKGDDYIAALSNLYELVNKNDKPFTIEDIVQQPKLNEFSFPGVSEFKFLCELEALPMTIDPSSNKRKNERIIAKNFADSDMEKVFKNSIGVVYIITCIIEGEEYIIKIGQTRKTFKERLSSYNCGVANNWIQASTTNIKMLQSMLTTRLTYRAYVYDCSHDVYQITWYGVQSVPVASPKPVAVEDILIKEFIRQFNKKPLAVVQADASSTSSE